MTTIEIQRKNSFGMKGDQNQRGSAIVIALFVLVLVSVFVALALSRTTSEAIAVGNETAEGRSSYAAQGSLELMTRNFNKVFETKLSPVKADFDNSIRLVTTIPGFTGYTFNQEVDRTSATSAVAVIQKGAYAGLYSNRDIWRLRTTATDQSGVQVQLTRNIVNNRIPIFQFGIFYNDDLEFHPGPRFDFGGRVHSNGSLFLMAQDGLYFNSRVSTVGEILTDVARNGTPSKPAWGEKVFIKNGAGNVQLLATMGSALKDTVNGIPVFHDLANKPKLYNLDMPTAYANTAWATEEAKFGGNLLARQKSLDLPLKITTPSANGPVDYIELIKRGKKVGDLANSGGTPTAPLINPVVAGVGGNADNDITIGERYYNKPGIRVSLADSKAKLPGCASGVGTAAIKDRCGVRLDGASVRPPGNSDWQEDDTDGSRGYQPLAMSDGYKATRLNGERFRTKNEVWIKIELVSRNSTTNAVVTEDVTEDILSLGITEPAPCIYGKFGIFKAPGDSNPDYYGGTCNGIATPEPYTDSRSIIKLQRFVVPGVNFVNAASTFMTNSSTFAGSPWGGNYESYNIIHADNCLGVDILTGKYTGCTAVDSGFADHEAHKKNAIVDEFIKFRRIVPFPIEMFDSREGIYNADNTVLNTGTVYGKNVPWAGVMSMVDVDVKNFRRFLSGEFDTKMPTTTKYYADKSHVLRNSPTDPLLNDVPQDGGWVVYFSDRRGDYDFDGEYDMEDIYGNNNGTLEPGENVNNSPTTNANLGLDTNYTDEAVKYTVNGLFSLATLPITAASFNTSSSFVTPEVAASIDHPYYRRGIRLINGEVLPGKYDYANSDNTKGFTVASENGVYVQGNYNATGISVIGTPTASEKYLPQGRVVIGGVEKIPEAGTGANHIPASIAADVVTILSNYDPATKNGWSDSKSFLYPFRITSNVSPEVPRPFDRRKAVETHVRFAMLSGDAKSSFNATPNQGGGNPRMGGGVHNFKRFLEEWSGIRLNYSGSLINLYNARNNNSSFKVSSLTYAPPTRNWVFDSSFLDPTRLPPGTPYFQFIQTTGFQRTND